MQLARFKFVTGNRKLLDLVLIKVLSKFVEKVLIQAVYYRRRCAAKGRVEFTHGQLLRGPHVLAHPGLTNNSTLSMTRLPGCPGFAFRCQNKTIWAIPSMDRKRPFSMQNISNTPIQSTNTHHITAVMWIFESRCCE